MATAEGAFERVWEDEPGILGWISTVDHKRIGHRYIITTFAFLLIAGTEALALRTQLARPQLSILTAQGYNQLFTMHGTTMIFLFIMPIVAGFGNYLVPLMIGARDMAFPRLNAFSYWVLLLAGIFIYSSFFIGAAPNGGWFNYVPLTGAQWSAGPNIDFWALGLTFLGMSTTAGAINFIVTIFKLRAPGMSIDRIPLFIWNVLIMAFMIVMALPALTTASVLLFFDRNYGTHFYDPALGGDPLLWQQLFWFFGHPDVYIFFMPPVGMASMIIPVFSRRPIVGYTVIVAASISIGLIAFGVWVHHMFATGLTLMEMSFFTATSIMIALPTAGQYWAWLSTIWHGRPVFTTAYMFALAFLVEFIIGGVTGVMQSVTSFDWQVTDSYFIVAHFHYTIIPSAVLPLMGGIYYWMPKITGRKMDERIGKWNFWVLIIGFNLTFFFMHIAGLMGMPRRVFTYLPGMGWDPWMLIATIGAYIMGIGFLITVYNFFWSIRYGEVAGDNPWDADTLEWATSSPPPPYNFRKIPVVHSRHPMWDRERRGDESQPLMEEQLAEPEPMRRWIVNTSMLDARPISAIQLPMPSYWPLLLALSMAVLFVGFMLHISAITIFGALATTGSVIGWLFPVGSFQPQATART